MLLSSYGLREWLTITVVAGLLGIVAAALGWWWALVPIVLVWGALVAFFRDPIRRIPADLDDADMLCPADGRISKILEVDEHEATDGPALVIRIFLSVLDVHLNRAPCDGEVIALRHRPGRYLDARSEESARVNESNLMTMRRTDGAVIGVRQVSGAIARRIVCPVRIGERLERGQRYGMIKFGSTTELILPLSAAPESRVREGQTVRAGRTVLAVLPVRSTTPAASDAAPATGG